MKKIFNLVIVIIGVIIVSGSFAREAMAWGCYFSSVTTGTQVGTVTSGTPGNVTFLVTVTGGGAGQADFSVFSGLPSGATASFSPNNFGGYAPWTSTLTINTGTTTPAGNSQIVIMVSTSNYHWHSITSDPIGGGINGTLTITAAPVVTPAPAVRRYYDINSPSAISNLNASDIATSSMKLNWTSPGDDGDYGTATSYDIRYATTEISETNWEYAANIKVDSEPSPQVSGTTESMSISGLTANTDYYFAIKTSDENNNTSDISNILSIRTLPPPVTVVPDPISGIATSTSATPKVIVASGTLPLIIAVASTTLNPSIDYSSFTTFGTARIPQTTITSANAGNVMVSIPADTLVTSTSVKLVPSIATSTATSTIMSTSTDSLLPSSTIVWDGILLAPTLTTIILQETVGQTKTLGMAIKMGAVGIKLWFSKAVKVVFPGEAGKRAGYAHDDGVFKEITTACTADNQEAGNVLAIGGECKIDSGADMVIWTKHFTTFATYTQVFTILPGCRAYTGFSTSTGNSCVPFIATTSTTTMNNVTVKLADVRLAFGSKGDAVKQLQTLLARDKQVYPEGLVTGYFGPLTKKAVIRFQEKYAEDILKPYKLTMGTGFVGKKTRAKLEEVF